MRVVHTSDWHAGRLWKGMTRDAELEAILGNLAAYLEREAVDLLLVSGDVFDHAAPSPDAERIVFQFFRRVGEIGVESVVIAGNHDHRGRMEAWGSLTELARVRTVASPRPAHEGGVQEIRTRASTSGNGETAIVAALPFATVGDLVAAAELARSETEARGRYASMLRDAIAKLCASFRGDTVNLLVVHAFFQGAVLAQSERRVHCTEQWTAHPEALDSKAQYVALGHIHKPQLVAKSPLTRYAGSPMALDFGEMNDEKSFVVIDVSPGVQARTKLVPYEGARPLVDVNLDAVSLKELEAAGDDEAKRSRAANVDAARLANGWLRINVALEAPDPDVSARVRRLFQNAVDVRVELPEVEAAPAVTLPARSPREEYAAYALAKRGRDAEPELLEAFDGLLAECARGDGS